MYRKEKNIEDIRYVLDNLRDEDRHEVETLRGENWKEDLLNDLMDESRYGHFVLACTRKDNAPAVIGGSYENKDYIAYAMGGCFKSEEGIGIVWLLTTPEALNHQLTLLRNIRKDILEEFDEKYWLTLNMIWKENHIAKKWLKRLGYRFPAEVLEKGEELNFYDRVMLNKFKTPGGFEPFYRLRETRGLS